MGKIIPPHLRNPIQPKAEVKAATILTDDHVFSLSYRSDIISRFPQLRTLIPARKTAQTCGRCAKRGGVQAPDRNQLNSEAQRIKTAILNLAPDQKVLLKKLLG